MLSKLTKQLEAALEGVAPAGRTALTVGVFDGVHLGHQRLVAQLVKEAQGTGGESGVITLHHSAARPNHKGEVSYLAPLETRVELLKNLGVDFVAVLPFTRELAQCPARDFVAFLKERLHLACLVAGPDFALGRHREGDIPFLKALGEELGFSARAVPPYILEGEVVSSTAIRKALAQGDMPKVSRLLGRPFTLKGEIVPGDRRGRELGFPTANLSLPPEQALPADGGYLTMANWNGRKYKAVTNIGLRPTFGGGARLVEVHLLDFHQDIYGQELEIALLSRYREEKAFSSVEELRVQIVKDVELARRLLS